MLFRIAPTADTAAVIDAETAESAMDGFAWSMDSDMNTYFKAIPYAKERDRLTLDDVKKLEIGKWIRLRGASGYEYNALVISTKGDRLCVVTENGAFTRPLYSNYGTTWYVEKEN